MFYILSILTKSDLKEISKIVNTETRKTVKAETPRIVTDIIKKELKPIKADIAKTRKDVGAILTLFDREYPELRTRVEKIETHLHLSAH